MEEWREVNGVERKYRGINRIMFSALYIYQCWLQHVALVGFYMSCIISSIVYRN